MATQPEQQQAEGPTHFVVTLQYFPVGDTFCVVCKQPGEVVRLATNVKGGILLTVMCEKCGQGEIDGLVERGDMLKRGGLLLNPKYKEAIESAAQAASLAAELARKGKGKKKASKKKVAKKTPKKKSKKKVAKKTPKKKAKKKAAKKKAAKRGRK